MYCNANVDLFDQYCFGNHVNQLTNMKSVRHVARKETFEPKVFPLQAVTQTFHAILVLCAEVAAIDKSR